MNTKLNKSDWIILAIVFGTNILLNSYDYYREGNKVIEYIVDFPTSTILSIFLILVLIRKIIPEFLVKRKKYLPFFISSLLLLIIVGALDNAIGRLSAGKSLSTITKIIPFLIRGLYNAADMVGLPLGILLIKKFYEGQQELVFVQKQQKENELKLLRSQLDPHFLFNNLNTLDSLIDSNPIKAKEYINRLSLIYRYLIRTKDSEVMELSEELELVKNYIFLIKTRFGNDYEFTIKENINISEKFIPTGALQSLLENVVKHNKSDGQKPIKTSIQVNEGWLIITNNKSKIKAKLESFGTGLQNLKSRYRLLSDEQIQVHDMENKFEVFIPIIELSN
ncbi:sensor histidine kinase [Polaribacter porphyrae]|uniref:Histidine kinase n=1 Tax=Polaribacter porphyrae TaxID=1137780 RepID=A0A2S7WSA2_9FLAO|nr:histidine kinase [Polaribacter porphyrae]PQJ80470.1 histidine kinase [Polaribacter porphyrae]